MCVCVLFLLPEFFFFDKTRKLINFFSLFHQYYYYYYQTKILFFFVWFFSIVNTHLKQTTKTNKHAHTIYWSINQSINRNDLALFQFVCLFGLFVWLINWLIIILNKWFFCFCFCFWNKWFFFFFDEMKFKNCVDYGIYIE